MKLLLKDKGLVSERYLRQTIYFMEYCRRDAKMSYLLFCIQTHLITLWSKHAFIKKAPFIKEPFLKKFSLDGVPPLDAHKLEKLLLQLDQFGYIKYYPAESPDQPDRFTMIQLLKTRAYPQIEWKGKTFRGIKSLKKYMQLNASLAIDERGLKMADNDSSSPFAPSLKQVKDLFAQYDCPSKNAVEFYRYYQNNDWIRAGKTMHNWVKVARLWIERAKINAADDQLKT